MQSHHVLHMHALVQAHPTMSCTHCSWNIQTHISTLSWHFNFQISRASISIQEVIHGFIGQIKNITFQSKTTQVHQQCESWKSKVYYPLAPYLCAPEDSWSCIRTHQFVSVSPKCFPGNSYFHHTRPNMAGEYQNIPTRKLATAPATTCTSITNTASML